MVLAVVAGCAQEQSQAPDVAARERRDANCTTAVDGLLDVTRRYLASIDDASSTAPRSGSTASSQAAQEQVDQDDVSRAFSGVRAYAADLGCEPAAFRDDLSSGLAAIDAGGPVATAVLLQLRADALPVGRSGPLQPGQDLAAAVAATAEGGVVELTAGTFVLDETLAVLRGVTLRGAGATGTVVQSAAEAGVLLVLAGQPVAVEGVALERTGEAPGPVVSVAPAGSLSLRATRVSGARSDGQGQGGVGVLLAGGAGGQSGPRRRTTLTMDGVEVSDNAVAGVLLAGQHRAEVAGSSFDRNGQCGICFLGTSDGAVRDSRFTGNAAGLVAAGDAQPLVRGATVTGGEVGLQVADRAAPRVEGGTFTGSARAAMIWTGAGRGSVSGSTCTDVPAGIVVGPQAVPFLGENACEVVRGQQ